MADNIRQLAAMLVPVTGETLLVPGTVVAEMIPYRDPVPVEGKPEWFLGEVTWRDETVPVVSFELVRNGERQPRTSETRIAVINGVSDDGKLPFYAMLVEGIPRSIKLDSDDIVQLKDKKHIADVITMWVKASGVEAVIPDLDKLEEKLLSSGC